MNSLKMDNNLFLSRILLVSGILLLFFALLHIFCSPLVFKWFTREIINETLSTTSPVVLFNHLLVGILLIPLGVSTMFTAAGVRAGHKWARAVAITNSLLIIIISLLIYIVFGWAGYGSSLYMIVNVLVTIIGIFMFLSLIWLRGR